jgi:hypothetical protein
MCCFCVRCVACHDTDKHPKDRIECRNSLSVKISLVKASLRSQVDEFMKYARSVDTFVIPQSNRHVLLCAGLCKNKFDIFLDEECEFPYISLLLLQPQWFIPQMELIRSTKLWFHLCQKRLRPKCSTGFARICLPVKRPPSIHHSLEHLLDGSIVRRVSRQEQNRMPYSAHSSRTSSEWWEKNLLRSSQVRSNHLQEMHSFSEA